MTGARPRVTICGLGPGDRSLLTAATAEVLRRGDPVLLRTSRHPGAELLDVAGSFEHVYETAPDFETVYRTITDEVVAAAQGAGHVVYAVPGSPLVLERSVRYLRASADVDVELLPAVSFLDEVWARLGVDPVDDGVRLVDGLRFATAAAGERGPLLVAHTHSPLVLSEVKLALDAGEEQTAVVLQGLGTVDETIVEVAWPDLDRAVEPDHLTSLFIPELAAPVGHELARSVEMMSRLRRDCPWDREQTHQTLRKYLIEEAYEVLDAIDGLPLDVPAGELPAGYVDLEEELGDLWFQILFHAELAAEAGQFTIADVARGLTDKMIRRHPHVYGEDGAIDGSLPANWDRLKQEEKQRDSALDGIPSSLPALAKAEKTLKRASSAGVATDPGADGEVVTAALGPEPSAERFGSLLLSLVEVGRRAGLNAEQALREATAAASERFRAGERAGSIDDRWIVG